MCRGKGRLGVGGGGATAATEDSVVPPGPRGWDNRAPILLLKMWRGLEGAIEVLRWQILGIALNLGLGLGLGDVRSRTVPTAYSLRIHITTVQVSK